MRTLSLLIFFLWFPLLCAQQPEQLTDYRGSSEGSNQISQYFPDGDRLLLVGRGQLDDPDFGAIMELDTATGTTRPLLMASELIGGNSSGGGEILFRTGPHLFARLGVGSRGTDLFVVRDDEVIRLTHSIGGYVSKPVMRGDSIFFLMAGRHVNTTNNIYGIGVETELELWTTDGTRAGTQKLHTLDLRQSEFINNAIELLANDQQLFLMYPSTANGDLQFYALEGGGVSSLLPGHPGFRSFGANIENRNPVKFGENYYLLASFNPGDRFTPNLSVIKISPDQQDYAVLMDDLVPVDPSPTPIFFRWLTTAEQLFLIIDPMNEPGFKVYRVDADQPDSISLVIQNDLNGSPDFSWSDGTLYYTGQFGETDRKAVYRYLPGSGEIDSLFTYSMGTSFSLFAGSEVVYLRTNANTTLRYSIGQERVDIFSNKGVFYQPEGGPFSMFPIYADASLLWGNDLLTSFGKDIQSAPDLRPGDPHVLRPTGNQPRLIRDFGLNNDRAVTLTADHFVADLLLLDLDFTVPVTGNIAYDRQSGATTELDLGFDLSPYQIWNVDGSSVISVFNETTFEEELKKYDGNVLTDLTVSIPGEETVPNYFAYHKVGDYYTYQGEYGFYRMSLLNDTLRGEPLIAVTDRSFFELEYHDAEILAVKSTAYDNPLQTSELSVISYPEEILYQLTIPGNITVLAASEEGAWSFGVTSAPFQDILTFLPADGSAPVQISLEEVALADMQVAPLGDRLVFIGSSPAYGNELFVADPQTQSISLLRDISPGLPSGISTDGFYFQIKEELLYFPGDEAATGLELWRTDGTTEGTYLLSDVNPGVGHGSPQELTLLDNSFFLFSAIGPEGRELYRLDLASETVSQVADVYVGPGSSNPTNFIDAEDGLYFIAKPGLDQGGQLHFLSEGSVATQNDRLARELPLVFPNPFREILRIDAPPNQQLAELTLYDSAGRLLLNRSATGSSASLALNLLPAGQYWLRSRLSNGEIALQGITKIR